MNSRRADVFTLIEMLIAIAILGSLRSALHATWQRAQ
jgi:prepilin-type N-terminal cleavage/methylation domain-containing protein